MRFRGLYGGAPVSGEIAGEELRSCSSPELTDALLRAVADGEDAYIPGIVDAPAALTEAPPGYATVAVTLDRGTARFDPPLEPEPLPDGAVA